MSLLTDLDNMVKATEEVVKRPEPVLEPESDEQEEPSN